tara:strand:+ start:152 stop:316 length:165 start_codon:yes stop_codon:yes gene_type:complete
MKTLIDAGVFKGTKDFLNHFKKYGGNYNRAESLQNLQTYKSTLLTIRRVKREEN